MFAQKSLSRSKNQHRRTITDKPMPCPAAQEKVFWRKRKENENRPLTTLPPAFSSLLNKPEGCPSG
jgi:hypothetical protein